MNTWGNDYPMGNLPTLMTIPPMMGNMLPAAIPPTVPPLAPPSSMLTDVNQMGNQFIGPVIPENVKENNENHDDFKSDNHKGRERDSRRDRERDRERGNRRSRSRNRDRQSYSNRDNRSNRERSSRGRPSKWDSDKIQTPVLPNNMMMHAGPMMANMQYANTIGNPMMNQMDMSNMQTMANMQQMPMANMANMQMMANMMMNQQMPIVPMFLNIGVILPPIPGNTAPTRREKPPACRTIFVGGLPEGVSEEIIMEVFQRFGPICEVKLLKQGVCHVRYEKVESVEQAFFLSGCRFKFHEQMETEATTLFIDYALNRDDQTEYEKNKRKRTPTPPRVEPYTPAALTHMSEKIKSDNEFVEAAPTLVAWLERGECNKKNATSFYALIQASNNQLRRLFNEKMQVDEEYQTLKATMKDKFALILLQFEQVAKILTAARVQRVSDHFSKQQRRNIEMWLKMTEELDNIKAEFNSNFDDEEIEKVSKNMVSMEKYEELKVENENLTYELEGYKNVAHLAKDEAERKFETFKAHFIAQQALQNKQPIYPPLPPLPKMSGLDRSVTPKPQPPIPLPEEVATSSNLPVSPSDAKLISILTAFLLVHPLGATLDYLGSYVKSMIPNVTQAAVHNVLRKYSDVFHRKTTGVGACIEHRWSFVTFDNIKN